MHSTLYQLYSRTLRKYLKFSSRLEKGISNGTFFKKSEYDQNTLVRRVERLKQKLEHLKLQLKLAAAGLATTLIMTTAEVNAQSPGLGPFVQQGRLDNPLRPPIQFPKASSDMIDIDNDGDLDLFVGEDDGSVHFFKNYKFDLIKPLGYDAFEEPSVNPYSNFQAYGIYTNSTIAFADIDGDGDTDAVVGFSAGSVPHLFFEYDAGAFQTPASRYGSPFGFILNGHSRPHFEFGNFDGDADLEAFVGSETGAIDLIQWNGSNWVQDNAATNLDEIASGIAVPGNKAVALYDIDGDTFLDAFIGLDNGSIVLYKGTSTPFIFNITEEVAGNPFNGIGFGQSPFPQFIDFDGDADIEMIVSTQNFSIGSQDYASIRVFENDGADNFQLTKGLDNPFGGVDVGKFSDPAWADIDNDGDVDIFIGSYDQGVVFYENQKDIYGYDRFQIQTGVNNPLDMVSGLFDTSPQFGRLDIDADLDLFVGTNNTLLYFKNIGSVSSPNFVQNAAYPGNTLLTNLPIAIDEYYKPSLGDIDDDGDLDAFVTSKGYSASNAFLMINNGTSSASNFDTPIFYNISYKDNQLADLDHDGDADLTIGTEYGSTLAVKQNQESYGLRDLFSTSNPFNGLSMDDFSAPSLIDIDLDGDLDLFVGNKYGVIEFFRNENQPPVLTIDTTPQDFTENGPSVQLDAGASITDPDANEFIIQGTISITNFVAGEDLLTFADDPDITEFWDSGTGVLTLSDTATAGAYAALIQTINYQNLSENPNTTPRTISLELRDTDFTNPSTVFETVNVIAINDPPTLTSTAGTTASEDITYTYAAAVTDPDDANNGTDLTWTLTGQPAGMTVSPTGTVSWTPGEGVLTSGSVTLTVQDGGEDGAVPDSEVFTITVTPVNDPPTITSTAPTSATEDLTYTYTATVADPDDTNNGTNLTWSLTGAPAGMVVSSTGVVTWTPAEGVTTSGSVTLTVQDGGEDGAAPFSEIFTITVTPVNDPPSLTLNTSTASYIENSVPVVLDNLANITDPDIDASFQVVVTINNYQTGEDILASTSSGSVSGTFDSGSGVLTISGTGTAVNFRNVLRSVTYENTSEDPNTTARDISILVDDGTTQTTPQSISLSVTAVNDAPVLGGSGTALDHTGGISAIDNTILASDVDNTNLSSAQVAITSGFQTGTDLLDFTATGSITGSFDSATGILSLTGTGTLAEYTTVLQSVTYQNTLGLDLSTKVVQFTVNDGTDDSNVFSRTINVDISDLPPVLTVTTSSFTYTENDGPQSIDPGLSIMDDLDEITGGTVSITTNFVSGEDIINFTDQAGITGSYDAATGILTLAGNATASEYETALASLTYENTSEDPGTVTKTVEIQLDDAVNTSTAASLDIQITPVNDPPQLAGSSTELSYRSLTGSVIVDDQITVTDVDDNDLVGAVISVASDYSSGEDVLEFTDQNGITGSFNTVTGVLSLSGTATKANYETALRSVAYRNDAALPSAASKNISFVVSDQATSGTPFNRTVQIASNQVVAASINSQVDVGSSITIDVVSQATFTPGDVITTSITGDPAKGTAVVNPDGSILYTPFNNDPDGDTDQIDYELCNEFLSCGSGTITVTINNVPPVINIDRTNIQPGGRATVSLLSGITDLNGNIDPSSIRIVEGPSSGLPATIDSDLNLIIDYSGSGFTGADHTIIEACDFSGACAQFDVVIAVGPVEEVLVYQGVTPNNDGINDVLRILDIEFFPENEIFIYNKIGKLVYNVEGYDNFGTVFSGFDDDGEELPNGTYYYVIILDDEHRQQGFFVLQR